MTLDELTGRSTKHLEQLDTSFQTLLVNTLVAEDLLKLIHSADKAGFQLEVASGFRDYARQSLIWNRKYQGKTPVLDSHSCAIPFNELTDEDRVFAILRWSALPGASRHHWGTDFDVYAKNHLPEGRSLELTPHEYLKGHQSDFYSWLQVNASAFGFFFPYAKDLGGVAIEPWHISHYTVSSRCLEQLTMTTIKACLEDEPILGAEWVLQHLDYIYQRYVINIDAEKVWNF